ncbi:hypothetical protein BT96DRAFT_562303 [Gymnopus androsaceus JB14]|uniref:Uncharacterized protein n=1 Tax=Gymnopus androsaceus JB14 TaxID=1447944 RepID=A0A6A4HW76_9AGAR|nr:hypothetical protein BT96DRAFT_562303 [Gymnopus androsaceus JB14]
MDLRSRRTEEFCIPAFRRETPSQTDVAVLVVRRSRRLASRPVKALSTAAPQGIFFRKIGELPVTPTKGRKKATQDALAHPAKRRRLADVSNLPGPSWRGDDESISAAPLKVKARNLKQGTRDKVKKFLGVFDENAVSNRTRSRSKS